MFLLKRVTRASIKQSYCRLYANAVSERNSKLKKVEIENNSSESLLGDYEEDLLYNTVIESQRMKYGFRNNAKIISNRQLFKEHMKTGLRTVQPLPLTLKYCSTGEADLIAETESIEPDVNKNAADEHISANFPYDSNAEVDDVNHNCSQSNESETFPVKCEITERKRLLDESKGAWMTHYENYNDSLLQCDEGGEESENWRINYGTPDPGVPISSVPCGGCGAYLHCKDTAIPGYIPSEIFKNSLKPGSAILEAILCQRCHFLKEYNIALQVRVSPEDYPKILQTISFNSALAVLMIDLTDFPCSIWPGIADILGPKAPIVIVGNKVDLLPKDDPKFLRRIKKVLVDSLKLNGFASTNIKHIELISAKTGYGVEQLISSLQKVWRRKGDVYLIGCTNVGKSSLFNTLLQSDFCKIQAADLIQRATTSPWPGTTLNLLKFPVTRLSGHRVYARHHRLQQLEKIEAVEQKLNQEALRKHNSPNYATLIGHVGRSVPRQASEDESDDTFSAEERSNLSGRTRMGINEKLPEFAAGKWCYDTPGVVHPDQMLHLLTTDELVMTLPKEIIRPETYCIKPGTSLFIAGLARLDYSHGPNSVRVTVFRANSLPITICKTDEADEVYRKLLGTELFMVPILKGDRAEKWPGIELAKSFKFSGKHVIYSSYDVVLSSAGWVAINCGLSEYEFKAWTPEKRGVHIRDSILPKAVTLRGARIRSSVAYKKHKFI